jgi:uncharacterized protein (TIGR02996 family)
VRTFISDNPDSRRFWNIDLQGKQYTVTSGAIFKRGRKQVHEFDTAEGAQNTHDRTIRKKLAQGFRETTPRVVSPLQKALEDALVADPDDLTAHMAYADYLMEQGDPRGEFIKVQMDLEPLHRRSKKKTALEEREETLRTAHQQEWLGELSIYLLDGQLRPSLPGIHGSTFHTFRRGWLDTLILAAFNEDLAWRVSRAPQVRLVHTLTIHTEDTALESDGALFLLFQKAPLVNVRRLELLDITLSTDETRALVTSLNLPRLESLRLREGSLIETDCRHIIDSGILKRLRVLELIDCALEDAEAAVLASCPDLARLELLNVDGNWLSDTGIEALRSTGVRLEVGTQDESFLDDSFYEDDWE